MAKKFKPGDVVQLNSGGPKMTVRGYHKTVNPKTLANEESDTLVDCEWFTDKNERKFQTFNEDTLGEDGLSFGAL